MSFKDIVDPNKAKIPVNERVDFYSFMVTLLANAGSLQEASLKVAEVLNEQANKAPLGKRKLRKAAGLYRYVASSLREGKTLHEALAGRIPDSEAMLLLAGDRGNLKDGLNAAIGQAKSEAEMRSTLIKGLLYPTGLFVVVVVAMNWIGNNLFPTLAMLKPVVEWTPGQQTVYWWTSNVGTWFPMALGTLILLGVLITLVNRKVIGESRQFVDLLPPFNVIRRITGASLLTTMASLILAGDTTKDALERILGGSKSAYMKANVRKIIGNMRTGEAAKGPGRAMGVPLFTPWIMVKLEIYGQGSIKEFAKKMEEIAEDARNEAMRSINGLSKLLNLLMLLTVGVVIGATVVTMYSITGSLKG